MQILDTKLKAYLSLPHLSDVSNSSHTSKIASLLKEGQILENCLVIAIDHKTNEIALSRKASLIEFAKSSEPLLDISSVSVSKSFPGYIKKVLDNGCLVGFVGSLQGFARLHVGQYINSSRFQIAMFPELKNISPLVRVLLHRFLKLTSPIDAST